MKCDIDGVVIRPLIRHDDQRGWLLELFRQDELDREAHPVMSYVSMTRPGVARGPHEHREQTDFFCFAGPSTFRLYMWDARSGSPTHGRKCVLDLDGDEPTSVLIPPGVVHAYKNIGSRDGLVYNAPNRLFAGAGRRRQVDEIRHEDDPNSPYTIEP